MEETKRDDVVQETETPIAASPVPELPAEETSAKSEVTAAEISAGEVPIAAFPEHSYQETSYAPPDEPLLDAPEGEKVPLSTRIAYTLRFTGFPDIGQFVAIAVATAVYTVLSGLSITIFPAGTNPLVSSVFIAIGFGIPFALWFGGWAFVIGFIGTFVSGLFSQFPLPLPFGLWFSTVDWIQLGIPVILYRTLAPRFGVSPIGKDVFTPRGFIFFLLCAVLPNNIIGGLYGNFVLMVAGVITPDLLPPSWFIWTLTNVVVTLVIGSILLATLSRVVERFGLTVRDLLR